MKVLCQAAELMHIDENVLCSGIRWLIDNQQPDGSYAENVPYPKLMINSKKWPRSISKRGVPMPFSTLLDLSPSELNERLVVAKTQATAYLEDNLDNISESLSSAIVAYALSLSDSNQSLEAKEMMLRRALYDEDTNSTHWTTESSAYDIQTAGYALLTQLLFNDIKNSSSIVNWLNTEHLQCRITGDTQNAVIALQAMTEYEIRVQVPHINLVSSVRLRSDPNFKQEITINEQNAQVLQEFMVKITKDRVLITTVGQGSADLLINVRYNVIIPPICKFDIMINVTDTKSEGFDSELNLDRESSLFQSREKLKYRISICVRYLGDRDAGMSIIDIGIFSGFDPIRDDLLKIQTDPLQLVERFEMSKRGVIFYLTKVPSSDKYCFNFRITHKFMVGNTHMSYINVYDYYKPDANCMKYYKPINNDNAFARICEKGFCQCAAGCPPKTPFTEIRNMTIYERREFLKEQMCNDFDYVWKGKVENILKENGFFNISFLIHDVVKAGIEKAQDIENETRTLLARDNCQTAILFKDVTYLILGRDDQQYMNESGETWYRYLLDKTSVIHMWTLAEEAANEVLQRDLNFVTKELREKGCEL